jgi:acetyltransferase
MQIENKTITIAGQTIILRPIKPEDEHLWLELLTNCSEESVYQRFRSFFRWRSAEIARRFCQPDVSREIAIVAQVTEDRTPKLIGVGRLIEGPDFRKAEYAILIADRWQGKGLGIQLTNFCMQIAGDWGIKKVYAETSTDNHRMVTIFQKLGFDIQFDSHSNTVTVEKWL